MAPRKSPPSSFTVKVTTDGDGQRILRLPRALVQAFRTHVGDTATIRERRAGGYYVRLYRHTRSGWRLLLPTGKTRPVRRPY